MLSTKATFLTRMLSMPFMLTCVVGVMRAPHILLMYYLFTTLAIDVQLVNASMGLKRVSKFCSAMQHYQQLLSSVGCVE